MQPDLTVETDPRPDDVRALEDLLYDFNVQTSGITDGELLAILLRDAEGEVIGGAYGWTWGGTCHLRYLVLPPDMRGAGQGTRIMAAIEEEAIARGCQQILLETHSFQAPLFYRKLGFTILATIDDYPMGHQYFMMVKRVG